MIIQATENRLFSVVYNNSGDSWRVFSVINDISGYREKFPGINNNSGDR